MPILPRHTEPDSDPFWNSARISEKGERVSHLAKDYIYYAHLSIYRFASRACQGVQVLDAGCGSGYGSAYLIDHGAHTVTGVDASQKAIDFCQYHFQRPGLDYRCMNLEQLDFPPASFDFVYSSNVLEHVPDVWAFLRRAHQVLKPGGLLLLAVPPIVNDTLEYENLINPYHLNIWTPRQWQAVLEQFFAQVQPYRHIDRLTDPERALEIARNSLDETQFDFIPAEAGDMYTNPTITAVFLASLPHPELPAQDERGYIENSYTRSPGHIPPLHRQRLQAHFEAARRSQPSLPQKAIALLRKHGLRGLLQRLIVKISRL